MTLDAIKRLVAADLAGVDAVIRNHLSSDVVLINNVAEYIIGAGGKRIRPLLVLVAAKACGYTGTQHLSSAAIVEFIHTATLLHDDVVDDSNLRRGLDTANAVWGNAASVLVGDYLYSRAFEMMVQLSNMHIMDVMASATNKIAEGEVLQLMNTHDVSTTEARYLEVIYRKTAKLFEAGARMGAIIAAATQGSELALRDYGKHLGMAFQLLDDVLDYRADQQTLGKNLGDDLAEGKPTLPLIYALKQADLEQQKVIRAAIEQSEGSDLLHITRIIEVAGGLQYTAQLAQQEAQSAIKALAPLPDSVFKQALCDLAVFAAHRQH